MNSIASTSSTIPRWNCKMVKWTLQRQQRVDGIYINTVVKDFNICILKATHNSIAKEIRKDLNGSSHTPIAGESELACTEKSVGSFYCAIVSLKVESFPLFSCCFSSMTWYLIYLTMWYYRAKKNMPPHAHIEYNKPSTR